MPVVVVTIIMLVVVVVVKDTGGLGGIGFGKWKGDISPLTGEEDQDLSLMMPLPFKQACYGWWRW
jgi:hypothetical protein